MSDFNQVPVEDKPLSPNSDNIVTVQGEVKDNLKESQKQGPPTYDNEVMWNIGGGDPAQLKKDYVSSLIEEYKDLVSALENGDGDKLMRKTGEVQAELIRYDDIVDKCIPSKVLGEQDIKKNEPLPKTLAIPEEPKTKLHGIGKILSDTKEKVGTFLSKSKESFMSGLTKIGSRMKKKNEDLEDLEQATKEREILQIIKSLESEYQPKEEVEEKKQAKKSFVENLAEIGYKTTEIKNAGISRLLDLGENFSKGNNTLSPFFKKYSETYKTAQEKARIMRESEEKTKKMKLSGIGQGFMNTFKVGRIIYDAIDTVSLKTFNPFRNITALSMFLGKSFEIAKETRMERESLKDKTRIKDEQVAKQEAWTLYNHALEENGDKLDGNNLNEYYKKNLCEDIENRLKNIDFESSGFFRTFLERDVKRYIDSINKKIDRIDRNVKLSLAQKQAKKEFLLKKNEDLLNDLDRMIGADGKVDKTAYWTRVVEKVNKGVANALVLDSVGRLGTSLLGNFSFFGKLTDTTGLDSIMGNKSNLDCIVNEKNIKFVYNNPGTSIDSSYTDDLIAYSLSSTELKPKFIDIEILDPSLVTVKKGDSLWRVLGKILSSTDTIKTNNAIGTVVRTIEKNPGLYGLNVHDINVVTIEDLKGVNWEKAIKKSLFKSANQ